MYTSALPLVLAALLASADAPATTSRPKRAAPAAQKSDASAASAPRDWNAPPPGSSPADAALWTRLRSAIEDATLAVSRMNKCGFRLRAGAYYEGLDALAKEPGARGEQARAVRQRLEAVARATDATVPKPLRTHVCKYTLLDLEQRMDARDDPKLSAELPRFREEASGCADELGGLATRLGPKVTELEGALAESDALLGRAAPDASATQGGEPASLLPSAKETR